MRVSGTLETLIHHHHSTHSVGQLGLTASSLRLSPTLRIPAGVALLAAFGELQLTAAIDLGRVMPEPLLPAVARDAGGIRAGGVGRSGRLAWTAAGDGADT